MIFHSNVPCLKARREYTSEVFIHFPSNIAFYDHSKKNKASNAFLNNYFMKWLVYDVFFLYNNADWLTLLKGLKSKYLHYSRTYISLSIFLSLKCSTLIVNC